MSYIIKQSLSNKIDPVKMQLLFIIQGLLCIEAQWDQFLANRKTCDPGFKPEGNKCVDIDECNVILYYFKPLWLFRYYGLINILSLQKSQSMGFVDNHLAAALLPKIEKFASRWEEIYGHRKIKKISTGFNL